MPSDVAQKRSRPKKRSQGKAFKTVNAALDREELHSLERGLELVKSFASSKFDESVDLVVMLGVNVKDTEQMLRGTVSLPSGTGKDTKVAVFAQGEVATQCREAGADFVGADDLLADVEKGKLDFDVAIATPDMMASVGKLGRILGPRGLMPNPKEGTVTPDPAKAVGEFKSGKVGYRTDKEGNVHVPIGKASFEESALLENFKTVIDELKRAKPAATKGQYIEKISISSTMGPGIKIDPAFSDSETD